MSRLHDKIKIDFLNNQNLSGGVTISTDLCGQQTIQIKNDDKRTHNIEFELIGGNAEFGSGPIRTGQVGYINGLILTAGQQWKVYCTLHEVQGMFFYLNVQGCPS